MAKVLVAQERRPHETRVAATPETVKKMVAAGLEVAVEAGAGQAAHLSDARFEEAGARVGGPVEELWQGADVVLKVGALVEIELVA